MWFEEAVDVSEVVIHLVPQSEPGHLDIKSESLELTRAGVGEHFFDKLDGIAAELKRNIVLNESVVRIPIDFPMVDHIVFRFGGPGESRVNEIEILGQIVLPHSPTTDGVPQFENAAVPDPWEPLFERERAESIAKISDLMKANRDIYQRYFDISQQRSQLVGAYDACRRIIAPGVGYSSPRLSEGLVQVAPKTRYTDRLKSFHAAALVAIDQSNKDIAAYREALDECRAREAIVLAKLEATKDRWPKAMMAVKAIALIDDSRGSVVASVPIDPAISFLDARGYPRKPEAYFSAQRAASAILTERQREKRSLSIRRIKVIRIIDEKQTVQSEFSLGPFEHKKIARPPGQFDHEIISRFNVKPITSRAQWRRSTIDQTGLFFMLETQVTDFASFDGPVPDGALPENPSGGKSTIELYDGAGKRLWRREYDSASARLLDDGHVLIERHNGQNEQLVVHPDGTLVRN